MIVKQILALIAMASLSSIGEAAAPRRSRGDDAELVRCIRRAASGRPWLEKTLWGLRDQEAGWIGAQVLNRNGTHDLGPLQVNSWWVERIAEQTGRPAPHIRYWLTHDACFNVDTAQWIFLSALASTGNYWKAIGVYHSPTGWRQRRYALSVAGKLQRRFGRDVFSRPVTHRPPPGAEAP